MPKHFLALVHFILAGSGLLLIRSEVIVSMGVKKRHQRMKRKSGGSNYSCLRHWGKQCSRNRNKVVTEGMRNQPESLQCWLDDRDCTELFPQKTVRANLFSTLDLTANMGHQQTIHFWTDHDRFPKLCVGGMGLNKASALIIILTKGIFSTWSQAPRGTVDVMGRWWCESYFIIRCLCIQRDRSYSHLVSPYSHATVFQIFVFRFPSFTLIFELRRTKD